MEQSGRSGRIGTLLLFIGVLGAIVVALIGFTSGLNRTFREDAGIGLAEISRQSASALGRQIKSEQMMVQDVADRIGGKYGTSLENAIPALQEISKENSFLRITLCLPDGTGFTTDGYKVNRSQSPAFLDAMRGESGITRSAVTSIGGQRVYIYYTPVYSQAGICGVVMAQRDTAYYQRTLPGSFYQNSGYSYVVSSDGNAVFRPDHMDVIESFQNLLDYLRGHAKIRGDGLDEMRANMAAGKSGQLVYTVDGVKKAIQYTPLDINDWYIVCIVPQAVLSAKTSSILAYTICLSALILLGFLILAVYQTVTQRRRRGKLVELAYFDSLTHIPNARSFFRTAPNLLNKQPPGSYAIILLDVDQFKYINDTYGYDEGNAVLCAIAQEISCSVAKDELGARMSGDYFILLLRYENDAALLKRIDALRRRICQFPEKQGTAYALILSFGIYRASNLDTPIAEMADCANTALKTVKKSRQSFFAFYDVAVQQAIRLEQTLEQEMKGALESRQFVVYYQPKYDVRSERMSGAEALVRWEHPTRGLIMPNQFIPIFERSGLVEALDLYVYEQVCSDLRDWIDSGLTALPVSVNFSRLHLRNPQWMDQLLEPLRQYRLPAILVEIELTESAVLEDTPRLLELMRQMHAAGFRMAMDDFGSAYSSLGMLKDIAVDILKLDREFFRETADSERGRDIVAAAVCLAKSLGIEVVAEGVETRRQLAFLREIQCDTAQGYLFGKPMPRPAFTAKLAAASHEGEDTI